MPNHQKTVNLSNFKGINNVSRPENTALDYLKEAINVDISKSGDISKRVGYSQVLSGTNVHSLWGNAGDCYYVNDGTLRYLRRDYTYVDLDTSAGRNRVDYLSLNGKTYYVSQSTTGILDSDDRDNFGIERPVFQPTLSEGAGSLEAGMYQVAISYVDSVGKESGSKLSKYITVSDRASIALTNIPVSSDSNVEYVRVYMSTANGDILYIAKDITNGTTSTSIHNDRDLVTPNETLGIDKAPKGSFISYYNGRILIADENILWYSEPYTYEWFKISSNFYQFESDITMIIPFSGGVYIGLESKLIWLSGNDMSKMSQREKEMCHPVKYSNIKIPSGYIRIENTPLGPKWIFTSDEGMYICMEDGVVFNVTATNVAFPTATESASVFMQNDGINKYISLLKNQNSDAQNMAVGDLVTAEVIRNGVVIP